MWMAAPMAFAVSADETPVLVRDPAGIACLGDALYVADSYTGGIIRVDRHRQQRIAMIETAGVVASNRIGGIVATPHGTLYVARIGHGHRGAIFRVEPEGLIEELDKLPARYWRYGLAYDVGEHALYTTQFMSGKRGAFDGSIVSIDLVSCEPSTVLDGFSKPMGIAKLGSTLVVADARQRAVFRVDLVAGRAVFRLQLAADIDRPDTVCACDHESVLVTTYDEETRLGAVRRLWLDGKRSAVLARGPWEPRGIATDGTRVFVAAHRAARVLVFPL